MSAVVGTGAGGAGAGEHAKNKTQGARPCPLWYSLHADVDDLPEKEGITHVAGATGLVAVFFSTSGLPANDANFGYLCLRGEGAKPYAVGLVFAVWKMKKEWLLGGAFSAQNYRRCSGFGWHKRTDGAWVKQSEFDDELAKQQLSDKLFKKLNKKRKNVFAVVMAAATVEWESVQGLNSDMPYGSVWKISPTMTQFAEAQLLCGDACTKTCGVSVSFRDQSGATLEATCGTMTVGKFLGYLEVADNVSEVLNKSANKTTGDTAGDDSVDPDEPWSISTAIESAVGNLSLGSESSDAGGAK